MFFVEKSDKIYKNLVNEFNSAVGNINIQKSVVFLYASNKQPDIAFFLTLFIIASKNEIPEDNSDKRYETPAHSKPWNTAGRY